MKKIILAVLFVATALSASAWSANYDKAVYLVAAQNFTPETSALVAKYVGKDITRASNHLSWHRRNGRHLESEGWHSLYLDKNLQHSPKDENDAIVQIEKALEILRNHKQHNEKSVRFALCTVMNLVIDMHNISNVAIEGVANSGTDFQFTSSKGTANGRPVKYFPSSWRELWTSRYIFQHSGYTPAMWANEFELMFGDQKTHYSAGTLADWSNDIGQYTKKVHDVLEANEGKFLHATIQEHEDLHMACMARAVYRIAALLNENFK